MLVIQLDPTFLSTSQYLQRIFLQHQMTFNVNSLSFIYNKKQISDINTSRCEMTPRLRH